jgi:uncharacterized short protein YbdD (DUF466 family)
VSLARVFTALARSWSFLRDLTGDAAYDAHAARAQACREPLRSRKDFYLEGLRRKYDGLNRCC